jgi:tetratricopeptide (TPR) repeat protein
VTPPASLHGPTASADARLADLVDRLTARLQAGEPLDLDACLRDHPEHAERLRQLLPALRVLADASRERGRGPVSDTAPLLGELGDFRLRREVGRGGMGVVYEAEQVSLGRRVALKVLPFASTLDPKQLQRFKNEAQAAASLHHQHIVPVYATGCERGVHYYAMQFIAGQTLATLIAELRRLTGLEGGDEREHAGAASARAEGRTSSRSRPSPAGAADSPPTGPYLPEAETPARAEAEAVTPPITPLATADSVRGHGYFRTVARLGIQAAEALEHAHQLGVVHRDIKPANLLVDERGNLWVTDFGLAHCQSQAGLTMTGDLVGTLRYMSPEQALAQRVLVDHRTDIYSLGVTLYELLTLEPAFDGRDRAELLRQIAFEEPPPPRHRDRAVPADLETVVLKAIAKSPAERYATAQELADDLERFVKDEPIRARRPTVFQRARKWTRRHRAASRAMACVAGVCLFALGVFAYDLRYRSAQAAESLERARVWTANDRLGKARQELAAAKSWLGTYGPLLLRRAAEVEALEAELDNFERFLALVDQAHEAEFPRPDTPILQGRAAHGAPPPRQGAAAGWDPARAVPLLLDALSRYRVLEQDDWSDRLERTIWTADQVARVRWTVYEELLWLANDLGLRRVHHRSGRKLSAPESAQEALAYLRKAEAVPRLTPAFYRIRAACHKVLGADGAARKDLELGARIPAAIALDHDLLAVAAFEARDKAEAVRQCEAALRLEPTHYWSLRWLGASLCDLGRDEKDYLAAAAAFTGCIMKHPEYAHAYFCRGNAYLELQRTQEAMADYSKALDLEPTDARAWRSRGTAYYRLGQPGKALADFGQAIQLDPQNPLGWNNQGWAYIDLGQPSKALAAFAKAIQLDGKFIQAWKGRGKAYYDLRQPVKAAADFREARRLAPKDHEVYHDLGDALADQGMLADAESAYREAIRLKSDCPEAHYNLGLALDHQGKPAAAVPSYREAIRLRDPYPEAHTNLGTALFEQEKFADAEAEFRLALRQRPDFREAYKAHFNLGNALEAQRKHADAEKAYGQALALKPGYFEAHLGRGNALDAQGKHGAAEVEYREAIRLQPNHPGGHLNLADTLQAQGNLGAAEQELRFVIRLEHDNAEAHCGLGEVLVAQGRFVDALAAFRRGHELGSKQPDWHVPSAQLVHQAERLVALDAKLAKVLQGVVQPADAAERIAMAQLCQVHKKRYAAAARLYAAAFVAEPKQAEDLRATHRYNAACAAALAGCGQGQDAPVDAQERARLRRQALGWLRADLTAWGKLLDQAPDQARAATEQALRHWQQDADFAGVRGEALAKLPGTERQPWQALWQAVHALHRRAAAHDTRP